MCNQTMIQLIECALMKSISVQIVQVDQLEVDVNASHALRVEQGSIRRCLAVKIEIESVEHAHQDRMHQTLTQQDAHSVQLGIIHQEGE